MADGLQHLIVPELAVAAEIDGKVVGATFGLPDYNPRIREINGRLFPFGFIRLLRNRRTDQADPADLHQRVAGVSAAGAGAGADAAASCPRSLEWGVEEAEFSWVLESNQLSRGSLEKGGAKLDQDLSDVRSGRGAAAPRGGSRRPPACFVRGAERSSRWRFGRCETAPRPAPASSTFPPHLRRGSAMAAAAVDRGQGVSRPPQASLL